MARVPAMVVMVLAVAVGIVRAQSGVAGLPPLEGDPLETLRTEPGAPGEYESRAFGPLLINVRQWALTMKKWSADPSQADGWATLDRVIEFTKEPSTHAGEAVSVYGRFRERQTLGGQYQGIERWLLELADREDASRPTGPVIVLFVVRDASVVLTEPEEGWYVSAAARYYKSMELPVRSSGEQMIYPTFVGAVFEVSRTRAGPLSEVFVWVALAVAVLLAIGLTVAFMIVKRRGSSMRVSSPTPSAGHAAPMVAHTPEEAMRRLREDAERGGEETDRG